MPVNYDLEGITAGTLNITPAPLTIRANNATRQYYSNDPIFSYKCSGFVNNEDESVLSSTPTLSTNANLNSNVGTYEIKVSDASCSNYIISYVNGTLTITPRTLIASVDNYERLYNEENPVFEVNYDGFVGDDDKKVLITNATASTTATKTSDVGLYPINVTGGSANNYKFSYTSGVLTINKAEQAIIWNQNLSGLKIGDQVELTAVASSGLPVTYLLDAKGIAEIYSVGTKTYLDCKANGQFVIRAMQEGNNNYYSSIRVSKQVSIGYEDAGILLVYNTQVKIQSMSFGVRVIDANTGDRINIYSSDGILQKSVKAEGKITDILLSKGHVYIVKIGRKTVKVAI